MLIIGERINTSREDVRKAVGARDAAFIKKLSRRQVEAGANMLDVNCGTSLEKEPDDLNWLIRTIQEEVGVPLCIDSPSPEAIANALPLHKGKALINSITLEESRYEKILPLVKKYNSSVVALTMDEKNLPETAEQILRIAEGLLLAAKKYGIAEEDIYFDPLVKPVSSSPKQAREFLDSIRLIKNLGRVKVIGGLSNVSFGLPKRGLLNSAFLAMACSAGLDAAIIDALDKSVMSALRAAEAITGRDPYCRNYLTAYRQGKL